MASASQPSKSTSCVVTRNSDYVWLIGNPCQTISGNRLPSGSDVMVKFIYYHRSMKHTIARSSQEVNDQLMPFWNKSRIPIKSKHYIVRKISDLFNEQIRLMKHRTRSNKQTRKIKRSTAKNWTKCST